VSKAERGDDTTTHNNSQQFSFSSTMTDTPLLTSIAAFGFAAIDEYTNGAVNIVLLTVAVTLVLEVISLDTVRRVLKQPDGKSLYLKALLANLVNHVFIGIPIYIIAASILCTKDTLTPFQQFLAVMNIWLVHSVMYYSIHRTFHEYPHLYIKFHSFHHRFNTHVPPISANAVTPGEYLVAYVIPFGVALVVKRTDLWSLSFGTTVMSICNLLVHTPKLEAWSEEWMPAWLVSTNDHLNHHRKLNTKYASPTFNIDYFVERLGWWQRPPTSTANSSSQIGKNRTDNSRTANSSGRGKVREIH
jgi:sterol desaturase/sphingolipid hydroxylase (fatty acid hydroxylase superfamily)